MSPEHPKTIVVPAEGLHASPLGHIPHPDALVLRVRQDELLAWVEDGTGHVVVVTTASIQLPRFGFWAEEERYVIRNVFVKCKKKKKEKKGKRHVTLYMEYDQQIRNYLKKKH